MRVFYVSNMNVGWLEHVRAFFPLPLSNFLSSFVYVFYIESLCVMVKKARIYT